MSSCEATHLCCNIPQWYTDQVIVHTVFADWFVFTHFYPALGLVVSSPLAPRSLKTNQTAGSVDSIRVTQQGSDIKLTNDSSDGVQTVFSLKCISDINILHPAVVCKCKKDVENAYPAQRLISILWSEDIKRWKISVREPCLQYLWGRRNSRCYEITETIYTLVLLLSLNSFSTLDRRKSPATSFFNLCFSSKNVEKAGAWQITKKNVILKMQVEIVQCTSCSLTSRKFKAIGSSFSRRPYSTTHWPTSFTTFCFVVRMYEAFSWSEPSESSAWYVHWWLRGIKTLYKLCLLLSSSLVHCYWPVQDIGAAVLHTAGWRAWTLCGWVGSRSRRDLQGDNNITKRVN